MDILEEYCDRWKLQVKVNKTKVLIFKKGRLRKNTKFTYKEECLEIVNNFKYLGVIFTVGGSFNTTFEALYGQALKSLCMLKFYMVKFPSMSISHKCELFDKLIEPILSYGCEIWGMNEAVKLENIHLKFCKQILGVRSQTQNTFVYGELGRYPLKIKRLLRVVKYWFKIIRSTNEKYIKHVYDMMLNDFQLFPEKKSWVKSIRNIFENLGFNIVWLNQGVENVKLFLSVFKQRIYDNYNQIWNSDLQNSSRAKTYRLYSDFVFQPYLNSIKIDKFRIALTRFRVSAHRLEIEAGRWHKPNKIPYNERKCKLCKTIEDEMHFLLECPMFSDIRMLYIKKYYWKHSSMIKFIELLKSENENIVKNLALFVYKGFEIRNNNNYVE